MKAHAIYRAILIATGMLAELRPTRDTPEANLLAALYPALRHYEDETNETTLLATPLSADPARSRWLARSSDVPLPNEER